MSKELSIENLEDYAFYESGLSADGCLEKLDDYAIKAIKRYGEILLEKQKEEYKIKKMKTTGSMDIKDYKVNTRILYTNKTSVFDTLFEGTILEFSDSDGYVCIQAPDSKIHWHKVKEIQIVDTLKNKAMEEFKDRLVKDSIEFAEKHDLYVKPKETLKEQKTERSHYEVYPNYKTNEPTPVYFLEIYNGKTWKLCVRNTLSVPKFGMCSEMHPYTLGEGEIAEEHLINMYTIRNLKRIVDGLNMEYEKNKSQIYPYPDFETAKDKMDWQKVFPHSITTSNPIPNTSSHADEAIASNLTKNMPHFSFD